MIVRSIRVADWRCFLDTVEVGPFDDGLNIIFAPNATGKSTLFEAFRRALLDGHKVTGKDVEALRPWGRDLAPKVTIEIIHLGQEYRISKQFLVSQSSLIERKEQGRYQRLAEGVAADEKTREIITKNPPSRGLSRPEHWGLAQVLWVPQGDLALGTLSGDLIGDIRSMLSTQVTGTGTGPIEKLIEESYLEFFSPKGKVKTGKEAPLLSRLKDTLAAAIDSRRNMREQYLIFEDVSRRVEELQARRKQARHDADEVSKSLREARTAAEVYRQLIAENAQRSEKVTAAETQYKEIKQKIDSIKATEAELNEAHTDFEAMETELPLSDREYHEREQEAARLKATLEDARKGREAVDVAKRHADAARRFGDCSRDLTRLNEHIEKVEKADKMLSERRQKRNSFFAPDTKLLREVRNTIKARDDARIRIEDSLITLEIVPKSTGTIESVAGETVGTMSLEPGVPRQIQGSPEVVVEIPKVARIRAWGPVGSVAEHREARAKAEKKLQELLQPYDVTNIDQMESLAEKGKELDADVSEAFTKVQTLLSGKTLDLLEQEKNALTITLQGFFITYPGWKTSAPDTETLEINADETEKVFVENIEGIEDAWEKAQTALTAVAGRRETLARRLDDKRQQNQNLSAKLSELNNDGKSFQEREKELQHLSMVWDAAKTRLREIEEKLELYEDDPMAAVERLDIQLEAVNEASSMAREREVREEARLEILCAQGLYSALALSEERVAQLEEEVAREELHAEAIKLLYNTVAACRAEAIASVSGPVEAAATRILQRISGRRLGRIQVGDGFEPFSVVPESTEAIVSLDNLSGGEQEQLYLATRLALADVIGKDDRQLVVMDDVLTATDSGRLARILNVLEEAAQRLQILILTCHPERYRGLKQGIFFDLESLAHHADLR